MTVNSILRRYSIVIALLSLSCSSCIGQAYKRPQALKKSDKEVAPNAASAVPNDSLISIAAVGDLMLGTRFPQGYLPADDDAYSLIQSAAQSLQEADISFGNLEGAFLDEGEPKKQVQDPTKAYFFAMPERYAEVFGRLGFDLMSLANNHSGDFGEVARTRTKELLRSQNIAYAGLLSAPTAIVNIKGLRVGLCAFSPNTGTCNINNYTEIRRILQELRQKSDLIIASCHMGAEGKNAHHITRAQEIYLGENRGNPYEVSRLLIDEGADIVIGHGPHLPRAIDLYKERLIVYSLGNFTTYGRFNISGAMGLAPLLKARLTRDGRFVDGSIESYKQDKIKGTLPDPNGEAALQMKQLTEKDFPNSPLSIDTKGNIKKR